MALYGGSTPTPHTRSAAALYLLRNEAIAARAQVLTSDANDWWFGTGSPDSCDANAVGMLFYDSRATASQGRLVWVDNQTGSTKTNLAIAASSNRNHDVTALWNFNPAKRGTGAGTAAPFTLGTECIFQAGDRTANLVAQFNADYLDGYGAIRPANGLAAPSADTVPVYHGAGRLAVADPTEDYDAVNRKTFLAGLSGLIVLAPVRVATAARLSGTRSGNVITAGANGILTVDGIQPTAGQRILLKDQQTGGTAVDNGVYTVTNAGSAGTTWVITRSTDADATGELTVGSLVFVEEGTANQSTQWSAQKTPGGSNSPFVINTDQIFWQKSFQQSAYTAGRGLVLNGLEFNFAQNADYTVGNLFTATGARTVAPLASPPAKRWLSHPGTAATQPVWNTIAIADITDWPNPILRGTPRTQWYFARFEADTGYVSNGNLAEESPGNVVSPINTIAVPTMVLGSDTKPWGNLWTSDLRLKATQGTGTIGGLFGSLDAATDPNLNHRKVVVWTSSQIKSWLGYTPGEVGAVPTDRTLGIFGTAGQITVATQNTWDLSANRTWTLGLDLTTLDTHWCTLHTDQSLSGTKSWYSVTSSASESMIQAGVGVATEPTWVVKAGGAVFWGDGIAPAAGSIDFSSDRLRVTGKPFWFSTGSPVKIDTLQVAGTAPAALIGRTVDNWMRDVTAADLVTFVGSPALAAGAVGYGGADNRLTGNAAVFTWDASNTRLGLGLAAPAATLDILGAAKLTNTVTTGTYPGLNLAVTDTSTVVADWTNRTMYGASVAASKTGTATYVTTALIDGIRSQVTLSGGSVSSLAGIRSVLQIGHASAAPSTAAAYAFASQPAGAGGSTGVISALVHFRAFDITAPFPQPAEHYGLQIPHLASGVGASRTAGIRLDLTTTGTGERFNLYAPGTAPSYFAGNLGLGVTTPTARLELAVGTTTLAPFRFASTSSALLTALLSGALESDGNRLWFTDKASVPVRHGIAHLDDLNFTNDPAAPRMGAVVFGPADRVESTLTAGGYTEAIGTALFTIWMRFRMPIAFRGPTAECICSVCETPGASSGGFTNAVSAQISSSGILQVNVSVSGSSVVRAISATSVISRFGGKLVDLVIVRSPGDSMPTVYLNGAVEPVTESVIGTRPAWDLPIVSNYFVAGNFYPTYGTVPQFHRAAFFNRALTASEVLDLSRNGIAPGDRWGSEAVVKSYNFATDAALSSNDAANMSVLVNQTVNGSPGWLTATRLNSTGRMDLNMSTTGYWKFGMRLGAKIRAFVAGATPSHFGLSFGGSVVESSPKVAVTAGVETVVSPTSGNGASSVVNTAFRVEPGTSSATTAAVATFDAGTTYAIKTVDISVVGAIVDLDLGVGCGTAIPDRSGRYHGTLSGTTWSHYIGTCPTELPSGSGTVSRGLRRYTQTISAKDGDTVTVTHGLGTTNLTVAVWNAAGGSVQTAVQRKAGNETNAIDLGFALVGAPSTPVNFLVVVIG